MGSKFDSFRILSYYDYSTLFSQVLTLGLTPEMYINCGLILDSSFNCYSYSIYMLTLGL